MGFRHHPTKRKFLYGNYISNSLVLLRSFWFGKIYGGPTREVNHDEDTGLDSNWKLKSLSYLDFALRKYASK
jgi:hypothetical protein